MNQKSWPLRLLRSFIYMSVLFVMLLVTTWIADSFSLDHFDTLLLGVPMTVAYILFVLMMMPAPEREPVKEREVDHDLTMER